MIRHHGILNKAISCPNNGVHPNPKNGDYRVRAESPALKLGFKNLEMDKFGLLTDFSKKMAE